MQQLGPGLLAETEFKITNWVADVPASTTINDMIRPDYWALHASKFTPWDRIQIRASDMSWLAEVVVLDCSRTWAKVRFLNMFELSDMAPVISSDDIADALKLYEVRHRGPRKWSVIRLSDAEVMVDDINTREVADAWLRDLVSGGTPKAA